MTLQVDIPDDFLRRLARIYEFKYDMANMPLQDITEQDVLAFLDEALSFIDGTGLLKEEKKK
jgi:hypothetical protein